ncbi:MAG: hypothetical protein V3Q69_05040 [Burkholderia sp.]
MKSVDVQVINLRLRGWTYDELPSIRTYCAPACAIFASATPEKVRLDCWISRAVEP